MSLQQINQRRSFLVVLAVLGFAFLWMMRPFFSSFILGAILVVLTYPIYSFLLRKIKFRKKSHPYIASLITTFLILVLLVLPLGVILAKLVNQGIVFFSQDKVQEAVSSFISDDSYQKFVQPIIVQLQTRFQVEVDLPAVLTKVGREVIRYITSFSPQVVTLTGAFLFHFFVMHFTIFFLFVEGKNVMQAVLDLSPLKATYEEKLSLECKNMIYATIYGYLVTALVQAFLAGVGFAIAGVPAPLVLGTITFFMAMVPVLGATAVWLPITIWLFAKGDTGWGIFLAIYGFVAISGIDNILKPLIIQGKAKIHPLLIFFSIMGGIAWFGPLGILFGPVISALFLACLRIYREDFLNSPSSS